MAFYTKHSWHLNMGHAIVRLRPQPYTRSPSALAIRTACGREIAGAFIENAAFNPSIPPWKVCRFPQCAIPADAEFTDAMDMSVRTHKPESRPQAGELPRH